MGTIAHLQRTHLPTSTPSLPAPSLLQPARLFALRPFSAAEHPHPAAPTPQGPATRWGHALDRIAIFPPAQEQTTGLPAPLKAGIEHIAGLALDDVRVHYQSSKPAQIQARAYTQGADIYVGPGQEQHVPHEVWHVVQQKQGRVRPTRPRHGLVMNDEPALEREATTVGRKVMRGHPLHGRGPHVVPRSSHNSGPIQRIGREEEEPLGPPPPLPPIPSKFVQPPPLPKKPPAIKVAKVLFPFSDVKSQAPVHTPEEKLAFLVEYATRYLIDALYRISTIQEFDDDSVHMNRTRLKTHAMILTEILQSAQRKYKEPEVQQRIAALLHPLPRLIQLADPPLAVLAEQWPGIRAELTSTLEFFMTKLGVY